MTEEKSYRVIQCRPHFLNTIEINLYKQCVSKRLVTINDIKLGRLNLTWGLIAERNLKKT